VAYHLVTDKEDEKQYLDGIIDERVVSSYSGKSACKADASTGTKSHSFAPIAKSLVE